VNGASSGQGIYTSATAGRACLHGTSGCLIISRALQGKTGASHTDATANSWRGGANYIVFRESEQLLPVFVLHYKTDK
jgi:hypothetical protein